MLNDAFRVACNSKSDQRFIKLFRLILIVVLSLSFQKCETDSPTADSELSLFSDNFDGEKLNANWQWTNEPGHWDLGKTKQGWLSITGNLNSNLWCSDETSTLYQIISEDLDFDVSTRLSCQWGNNSSDIAGIIVKFPDIDNWINIKLWMHGDGTGRLEFQKKCDDLISPVPGYNVSGASTDLYLRIVKKGMNYTSYYSIRPVNPIFPLLKLLFNLSETRFQQSKGNKQNDTTADFTFRASPRDVSSYRTLSRERHDTKTFL
jgi:hypothetical protein